MYHPTAIKRNKLSAPLQIVAPLLRGSVLDFGCGRGECADRLRAEGMDIDKFDPVSFPLLPDRSYDNVLLMFVLNVLRPQERKEALEAALAKLKAGGSLWAAVRIDKVAGTPCEDGVVTKKNTFQSQLDVEGWKVLFGVAPIARKSGFALFQLHAA